MRCAPDKITGLYVHVPFCDGKCSYCAFYSERYQPALAENYLEALARELARAGPLAPETIYLGGGTPSALSVGQLERLGQMLRERISPRRLREWTIEINPGSLDAEKAATLTALGINRFSIGAQSFNDHILQTLGRRHAAADTVKTVKLLRAAGAKNISLDLIAGVPGCPRALWRETLLSALALAPNHISVYALTNEEGTRLNRRVQQRRMKLFSEEEQLLRLDMAEALFSASGFKRYEISNYAQRGFECRHNLGCWRGEEYIGLGPSAASHVGLKRWTNSANLSAYLAAFARRQRWKRSDSLPAVAAPQALQAGGQTAGRTPPRDVEKLTPALKRQDQVIFGLRMAEGISADTASGYEEALATLKADGLVTQQGARWVLTARGRNLADYVAVELIR
ncbi:MAG: radical SAM family heme chaperone HemW [Lentisphaerae bacterium]|nr:radical SAM family heme chaperone HemW [Lentisphaerota bacterium]